MYLGPLKWPSRPIWLAAGALTTLIAVLGLLSVSGIALTVIAIAVILFIAAPRRVKDLGADEMRDSRPDE